MGPDPHVIGIIPGDRSQYSGPLYAIPDHDQGERCHETTARGETLLESVVLGIELCTVL